MKGFIEVKVITSPSGKDARRESIKIKKIIKITEELSKDLCFIVLKNGSFLIDESYDSLTKRIEEHQTKLTEVVELENKTPKPGNLFKLTGYIPGGAGSSMPRVEIAEYRSGGWYNPGSDKMIKNFIIEKKEAYVHE